jgi:hypothetical protein
MIELQEMLERPRRFLMGVLDVMDACRDKLHRRSGLLG